MKMQKNEIIELCGMARAFVQISENGPRSKSLATPDLGEHLVFIK